MKQTPAFTIPMMGIILQEEPSQTGREILLNKLKQERVATSFNSILCFLITLELSLNEAVGETLRSAEYRLSIENTCCDFLNSMAY